MRFANYLKKAAELLDTADQEATQAADLSVLAKGTVKAASGAIEAVKDEAAGQLKDQFKDLGIVEGLSELTSQISTDLKGAAKEAQAQAAELQNSIPAALAAARKDSSGVEAPRSASQLSSAENQSSSHDDAERKRSDELKEHIRELESREAQRMEAQERLQKAFEEADAQIQRLQREAEDEAEAASSSDDGAVESHGGVADAGPRGTSPDVQTGPAVAIEAMRKEFRERQEHAEDRIAALDAEIDKIRETSEPVKVELEFWKEKVQRMLEAQGLTEVPAELREAAEQRRARADDSEEEEECDADGQDGVQADGFGVVSRMAAHGSRFLASRRMQERADILAARAAQDEARAVHERRVEENAVHQQLHDDLQRRLAELMGDSDSAMAGADAQRLLERELEASLSAAEIALADRQQALAAVTEQAEQATRDRQQAEEAYLAEIHNSREARAAQASAGEGGGEVAELRRRAEELKNASDELKRENSSLEGRLRKYRTAAAVDLERAVPLSTDSCWQACDGPTMKFVTLLVRSSCVRRFFAVHLLSTYLWLFVLLFWLESRTQNPTITHIGSSHP